MIDPIRIPCSSVADVPSPDQIAGLTAGGWYVVLECEALAPADITSTVQRLAALLPDHSVFGAWPGRASLSIVPLIARTTVLEHAAEIREALAAYRSLCTHLTEQYTSGTLAPEWRADEHGEHCLFFNRETGQTVEAPRPDWCDPRIMDPDFFAHFVRTTSGCEPVARLLTHDYHHAVRILEVLLPERERRDP